MNSPRTYSPDQQARRDAIAARLSAEAAEREAARAARYAAALAASAATEDDLLAIARIIRRDFLARAIRMTPQGVAFALAYAPLTLAQERRVWELFAELPAPRDVLA